MKKISIFLKNVQKELKKVRWPNKKEMWTYSIATLLFIFIFSVFFVSLDFLLAIFKKLVH